MSGCMVLDLNQACNCVYDDLWPVYDLMGFNMAVWACMALYRLNITLYDMDYCRSWQQSWRDRL